jgi:hypothetical protein
MATAKSSTKKVPAKQPVAARPVLAPVAAVAVKPAKPAPAATAKAKPAVKAASKVPVKAATKAATKAAPKATAKAAPIASAPKSTAGSRAKKAAGVSAEQRRNYIEVAAFYIAERRGFAPGNLLDDWVQAEAEIDRLLAGGHLGG